MNGYSGTVLFRIDKMKKSKVKSCFNCRSRKRRCTREDPSCTFCLKRGLTCNYNSFKDSESDLKEAAKVLVNLNPQYNEQSISNIESNLRDRVHSSSMAVISQPHNNKNTTNEKSRNNNDSYDDFNEYDDSYTDTIEHHGISSDKRIDNSHHTQRFQVGLNKDCRKIDKTHVPHHNHTNRFQEREISDVNSVWKKQNRLNLKSSCEEKTRLINECDKNDQVNNLNTIIDQMDPIKRIGPVFTTLFNSSINLKERGVQVNLNTLQKFIPDKTEADILVARYRTSVHSLIPVLDLQLFYPVYEQLWVDKSTPNLSFFITLFTIFYAASVSLYEERTIKINRDFNKDDLVKQMKYYMGCTEIALAMAEYPRKISIIGLQASVILYTLVRTDCRTDDFLSISSLVRCAQSLELNRDPSKYHQITDAKEIQLRRILWWQVLYLDCTTSLSTRLSPLIYEAEFDTQLPNEYKRSHNGDFVLDQAIAFFNGRCKWAKCCNKILKFSFRIKPNSEIMLIKITRDIEHLSFFCSSLIQRMLDPINIKPCEEKFVTFATLVLSTLVDRCHILISILFKKKHEIENTDQTSNKLFIGETEDISSVSDSVCLKFNEDVLENHIHLLNEFIKYGEMPRFSIFIWEIRKFQPIQTLLSLLRCIISEILECGVENKNQIHAVIDQLKRGRSVKIVDESMEKLSYLSEHTTKLCQQRWNTLFELKNLAWNLLFNKNDKAEDPQLLRNSNLHDPMFVEDEDAWTGLYKEMNEIENLIDENINLCMWDDSAGHYLV